MYIYHERQLGGLCGVHCLNNLLQGPHFGPGDLAEIGVELDREEQQLLAEAGSSSEAQEQQPYNVDSSADGGNFSIQVLALALKKFQLELLPAKHPEARELMKDPPKAAEAFLCQYRDHWFAIRQVADCWWNLNSTRTRPALVGPFYLAAWLVQLGAEGYSIFLVRGASLPEPAKPQEEGKPEENFHEVYDLLEHGKRAGGNPLSSDDDDEVVIPPDPDELAAAASLPAGFSPSFASTATPADWALVEMGYREPQIRAARELGPDASDLLIQVSGVDSSVESDGERLGKAIQEAVLDLDSVAPDAVGRRILQLVTLLSLEEEHLRASAAHVDASTLTEFLLSVIARRGEAWPSGAVRAASVALELVMAAPWAAAQAAGGGRAAPRPVRLESQQVPRPKGDEPPADPEQLSEAAAEERQSG